MELEEAAAAVARRRPHGVLCCWQPLGADWTAAFRACPSVRECAPLAQLSASASDAARVPKHEPQTPH